MFEIDSMLIMSRKAIMIFIIVIVDIIIITITIITIIIAGSRRK